MLTMQLRNIIHMISNTKTAKATQFNKLISIKVDALKVVNKMINDSKHMSKKCIGCTTELATSIQHREK